MSSNHTLVSLPDRQEHPYRNMEEDLLLLYQNPIPEGILFRHYEWEFPCWTCGYSQKFEYVRECTGGNPDTIFRRATGGGIVPHHNDWTFSLVVGIKHPHFSLPPREFYNILHTGIADILSGNFQIPVQLHSCQKDICNGAPPTECFQSPVLSDVLHAENGQKIAGAAIKKTREGILLQGSIQKDSMPGLDWRAFKTNLEDSLSNAFSSPVQQTDWPFTDEDVWLPYGERIHSKQWLGK